MAVRTQLPWWSAATAATLIAAVTAGLWWGYGVRDPGGGFDRRAIETRMAALEADSAARQLEVTALRSRNSELESEIAMARGAHDALARQASDLSAENAQLKERVAFLQQLAQAGLINR